MYHFPALGIYYKEDDFLPFLLFTNFMMEIRISTKCVRLIFSKKWKLNMFDQLGLFNELIALCDSFNLSIADDIKEMINTFSSHKENFILSLFQQFTRGWWFPTKSDKHVQNMCNILIYKNEPFVARFDMNLALFFFKNIRYINI